LACNRGGCTNESGRSVGHRVLEVHRCFMNRFAVRIDDPAFDDESL
jgi:hypothetical protein